VGGQRHAPAALPPQKTRYPLYRRLGGPQGRSGRVRKTSPPPDVPARSQSLYRLSYLAHYKIHKRINFNQYRMDGLGIESQWVVRFLHPSRPALGPTQPLVKWELGGSLSQGAQWQGHGTDQPPHLSVR
jgi:hypothetical protein